MKKFEAGKTYYSRSICDHEGIFTIEVVKRTEKSVTYIYDGKQRRSMIKTDESGEYIKPDRYSMAPTFRADREVEAQEAEEQTTEEQATEVAKAIVDGIGKDLAAGLVEYYHLVKQLAKDTKAEELTAERLKSILEEDLPGWDTEDWEDLRAAVEAEQKADSGNMKSCGNCAAACGIEGKNEVIGCKNDGKLHNAQEQKACFHVNDCDTCVHKYMHLDRIKACCRQEAGLDCEYQERELRACPVCGEEVYRDEMLYTKDCYGITFRLVCWNCYNRLMEKGYDGEYYDEADEQIEDDY